MNLVNCAMLPAFLLSVPEKPTVEQTTVFYRDSMMTGPMKLFCRMSGKKKFSDADIEGMKKAAALNPADRIPTPGTWTICHMRTAAVTRQG